MRHTRAHTANRRSHHAVKAQYGSKCPDCGALKLSHTACAKCGSYKGRKVVNTAKKAEKKIAKAK